MRHPLSRSIPMLYPLHMSEKMLNKSQLRNYLGKLMTHQPNPLHPLMMIHETKEYQHLRMLLQTN